MALFADGPSTTGIHVRANMVSALDGAATGADRVSGSINGPADLRVFRVLRALADVVLIGAGTARAECYTPLDVPPELRAARSARGRADDLELAVVTASGELPASLIESERPPLVLTTSSAPALGALRDRLGPDRVVVADGGAPGTVDHRTALAALADRGLRHVLTEGGPMLLGQLVDADLVDELCLTWSPQLVGGPAGRVTHVPAWFSPPRELTLAHLLHSDGVLLGRWQVVRLGA
ncbi:dihydrofolate reductase family protein [Cellulomonas sp. zg-ZUI188]|uniref:Dihydrofolate reductase family protein n=2 Tax=Cellulomonas fengjieae TaxID=2819978 RepID=A0ABS3SES0_9CELL|nr:dihydrofolate reductase family protein [Cellulomonas fengjieae]MBO3103540.1 dihydrofolate reductase family protein [Cellulomonas fengjieae]QVI67891.1 dihydrofolate reductase family protein [Cellulomonas fengjieae]